MGDVEFKINEDLIKGVVSEKMKAAIVEAWGGKEKLLSDIIDAYMDCKVNENGNVSNYGSENKYRRSDILIHRMLEKAMADALSLFLQERQEELKTALAKHFATKQGTSMLVKSMAAGFADIMAGKSYRYNFSLKLEDLRRD